MTRAKPDFAEGVQQIAAALDKAEQRKAPATASVPEASSGEVSKQPPTDLEEAALAADLEAFPSLEIPVGQGHRAESITPSWDSMQARLRTAGLIKDDQIPNLDASRLGPTVSPSPPWQSVAAGMIVVALLTAIPAFFGGIALERLRLEDQGQRITALEQQLSELSATMVNIPIHDLVPVGEGVVREDGQPTVEEILLPADTARFVVILNQTEALLSESYELEVKVTAEDTSRSWQLRGLRPREHGNFAIELAREDTQPGNYQLDLIGLQGDQRELLARYQVRIAYRSPEVRERQ